MSKSFKSVGLDNGVTVDFFSAGNRYFGDFHRVKIVAIATIPLVVESLPANLQQAAVGGTIKYEKTLERMGVTTDRVETVIQTLIDDFIQTVGCYLVKKSFAEGLLRKNRDAQPQRNRFSL